MPIDNRKKKEELNKIVEEAIEAPEIPEIKVEDVPVEEIKIEEPVEEVKNETTEEPEVKTEEVIKEPKKEVEPDYKEKYKESSKESLTQYFKNRKLTETIDEANAIPEPTEEEMVSYARQHGADYEYLDEFQKALLKDSLHTQKWKEKVSGVVKESKDIDAWVDKVDAFTESVETAADRPLVAENADEFKRFCMKAQRRGMDLEDLAASFLYGLSNVPAKKPSKGSMLLPSSGGGTPEKPVGLNEDDAQKIRLSNPKEYRRLIKEKKFKIEI
jgi:hypothetical protein